MTSTIYFNKHVIKNPESVIDLFLQFPFCLDKIIYMLKTRSIACSNIYTCMVEASSVVYLGKITLTPSMLDIKGFCFARHVILEEN